MVRLPICIFLTILLINAVFVNSTDVEVKVGEAEEEDKSESIQAENLKKRKKRRSTSSDSGVGKGGGKTSESGDAESLDVSDVSSTKESEKNKKFTPPNDIERPGWRKWHRKCQRCPEDMKKKWRDPSIKWICGVYQRARRSFKSACMMQYRNCQDGTMFVMLHDHRCRNETSREQYRHGEHFFYEYVVKMSEDSSNSKDSSSSGSEPDSSSSSY